jgi:hypothetical protein
MRCAEARRMDGQLFASGKKSFCLPGSHKDWPIGLCTERPEFDAIENILVVEGQPDYYAALSLAIDSPINFRPIVRLGATAPLLSETTKPYIRGKKILIIGHNDPQGQAALPKWLKELYRLGAKNVVIQSLPFEHDDLNDFVKDGGSLEPLNFPKGFDA